MSRGKLSLAPRRHLRERQLPWAPSSIPLTLSFRNSPLMRPPLSGHGGACSKAASSSIDLSNPKVAIAASHVGSKPDDGNDGTPVEPGVRLKRANANAANKRDAIGSGFLHPRSAKRPLR